MDTTSAFTRLRSDFLRSPVEKWGSLIGSVGACLCYMLLLVLLYLFVDLIVWKGEIPTYAQLSSARKNAFASAWSGRPVEERREAVQRLNLPPAQAARVAGDDVKPEPTAAEWELRWRAGAYLTLRARVNQSAADAYLPEAGSGGDHAHVPRLGLLSLVVREQHRWDPAGTATPGPRGGWFGWLVGWLASWNSWTWQPNADGTANQTYLVGLFVLAMAVGLVRGILLNMVMYFASAAVLDTVTRLRRAVYLHMSRLGSLAVRTVGPGEAVEVFTRQVEAVGEALHAWLTATVRHPLKIILLVILGMLVHFWLAVSFLLLAFLGWVIAGQVAAYFRREARLGAKQSEAALARLRESLGMIRLVKCFQMERFNQARAERQLAEYGRATWQRMRGDALSRPVLMSVALIAGIALLYLAARSVLAGEFTVAGLTVVAVALVSLAPALAGWLQARRQLRRGREAAEALFEFLDRKGEAAEAADAEFLPALTTRMEFRQVTLREAGTGRLLLENVSFAVPAGTRVAIVGSDTAEKRALMYLVPRFLDPTAGEIRIEDKNIKWVTHESLRAQVAVVMQDDLTFTDTVVNNIGCGDPGYNLPQIIEAAKAAHAHQFIEKLPYGYETVIGEHGHTLRPGERFRIALARALLRDPSILIVEEPTGPIDEDTLALLDDTLERAGHGRTILFLANRLSTLRSVDRVFLLHGGHLEASGSHRDLWQNNEFYRRLQVLADATTEAAPTPAPARTAE